MAKTNSYKRWTAEEIEYLISNYGTLTADVIAETLDRTLDSVWDKAEHEGIRKHKKRHERSEDGPWHCPDCNSTKPKEEFGKSSRGKGTAYCRLCINKRQKDKRSENRKGKNG